MAVSAAAARSSIAASSASRVRPAPAASEEVSQARSMRGRSGWRHASQDGVGLLAQRVVGSRHG